MFIPSISTIIGCIFLIYIAHSMWSMAQLFRILTCTSNPCFTSYLNTNPSLQLALFTSTVPNPGTDSVTKLINIRKFDYYNNYQKNFEVVIPPKTRQNGTMYIHVVLALDQQPLEWFNLHREGPIILHRISLTEYIEPKAATFNLLVENEIPSQTKAKKKINLKPVTHFYSQMYIVILTDEFSVSPIDVPLDLAPLLRTKGQQLLPILQKDFFRTRFRDLEEVKTDKTTMNFTLNYNPIGIGKLRLMLQIEQATKLIFSFGFSKKDIDEVKGFFSDTNVYLLCATVFVGGVHILFDFLSFKNDIVFWRKKKNYVGLSTRTTIWRAFSQIIIFLYLMDENTSLLVLIPAGIGTVIELWKSKKILKLQISWSGLSSNKKRNTESQKIENAEKITEQFDRDAMKYLCYILYPLCVSGALYSLIYQPHRSWYSFFINSLVNGVYAFGFLFMMPQLFVNYKLKSVAALPWRAFMYKAFNTFIDDIFAFIITMPTAHRVACFRDDIVFIIYLYQRWLYPVDKTRIDIGDSFDNADDSILNQFELNDKNNKKTQ